MSCLLNQWKRFGKSFIASIPSLSDGSEFGYVCMCACLSVGNNEKYVDRTVVEGYCPAFSPALRRSSTGMFPVFDTVQPHNILFPSTVPCSNLLEIMLCMETWPFHHSCQIFIIFNSG